MIKTITYPAKEIWKELLKRPSSDNSAIREKVAEIMEVVKRDGDEAVKKFTKQFDGVDLIDFEVPKSEWEKSSTALSNELKQAMDVAVKNISAFHAAQKDKGIEVETS